MQRYITTFALICILALFSNSCVNKSERLSKTSQSKPEIVYSSVAPVFSEKDEKLQVIAAIPNGNVLSSEDLQSVSVTFNKPMTALSPSSVEFDGSGYFSFSPPVKGKYYWIGTASLAFKPNKPFAPGTKYAVSISKNIKSISGETLGNDYSWSFNSLPPAIAGTIPKNGGQFVSSSKPLQICFNQKINIDEAKKNIFLYQLNDKGEREKAVDYTLKRAAKNDLVKDSDWNFEHCLLLYPSKNLELDSPYSLCIESGLKSGELSMENTTDVKFRTEKEFKFQGTLLKEPPPGESIQLQFSNPVRLNDLVKNIKFEPETNFSEDMSSGNYDTISPRIYGLNLKPRSEYFIILDPALKDINGNPIKLGQNEKFRFTTGDYPPTHYMKNGNAVVLQASDASLPIYVTNIPYLNVFVKEMTIEDILSITLNNKNIDSYVKSHNPSYFTINTGCRLNEKKLLKIPINKYLTNGKGTALVYVKTRSKNKNAEETTDYSLAQITDLTINAKLSPDSGLIIVTDKANNPVEGACIRILDKNNKLIWEGTTDKNGCFAITEIYYAMRDKKIENFCIFASKDNDSAFIAANWDWNIPLWDLGYKISDFKYASPYKASIFTEKNIYRPGNSVNIKGIVREKTVNGLKIPRKVAGGEKNPKKINFLLQIYDSRGEKIKEESILLSEMGAFNLNAAIDKNAPTGDYSVLLLTDEGEGSHIIEAGTFKIKEYAPSELDTETVLSKKEYFGDSNIFGSASAKWFFGSPLADGKISWNLTAYPYNFIPKGQNEYIFGTEDHREGGLITLASGESNFDKDGKAEFNIPFDAKLLPPNANITFETTAKSAKYERSSQASAEWHRSEAFIGIRPNSSIAETKKPHNIKIACFKADGNKYSKIPLTIQILKREWLSVKKEVIENGSSWINEKKDTVVKTLNATEAEYNFDFTPEKPGYYIVKVSGKDKKGVETISEAGFYASGYGISSWEQEDSPVIKLTCSKKTYKPGEKAQIFIPSPYKSAKAIITVEGDSVLYKDFVKIQGNSTIIEIPITPREIPGFFVSALILPDITDGSSSGEFKVGYAQVNVASNSNKLYISVSPNKQTYKPGEKATVKIELKDEKGNPAKGEVSIAVIDKGTLALTGYELPNLFEKFYGSLSLNSNIFCSKTNLISSASYKEKGDYGGGGDNSELIRDNFADVAYWNPAVTISSEGKADVSFNMPDSLTSFDIMAIGYSENKFSELAEAEATVSSPIVVKAAAPSFAHIGDEILCGVTLINNTAKSASLKVTLDQKDMKLLDSSNSKILNIKPNKEEVALFSLKAIRNGSADLIFKTEPQNMDPDFQPDILKTQISIRPAQNAYFTLAFAGMTSKTCLEETISIDEPKARDAQLKVYASSCAYESLRKSYEYLVGYPYDCLEQITSMAVPHVMTAKLAQYLNCEERVNDNINTWLNQTANRQNYDGGFRMWPSEGKSSDFLSCYVMHVIGKLDTNKYKAPNELKNAGIYYLQSIVRRKLDEKWEVENEKGKYFLKAYAIYVLGLLGVNNDSARNKLIQNSDKLGIQGKALLMRTLGEQPQYENIKQDLKRQIFNKLVIENKAAWFAADDVIPEFYQSDVSANSLIYISLLETFGFFPNSDKILIWLNEQKNDKDRWQNTHENALALTAAAKSMELRGMSSETFKASVKLNGKAIAAWQPLGYDNNCIFAETKLTENPSKIVFEKENKGTMYYSGEISWERQGEIQALDRGFTVMKSIEPLKRQKTFSESFKEGEIYKVTISVNAMHNRNNVVLTDSVPAGFEIIDVSLETESEFYRHMLNSIRMTQLKSGYGAFDHRQYYSDRAVAFASKLTKGEHLFTYLIKASYKGKYTMYPAKASMMYSPDVFGNTNSSEIEIK